MKEISLQPLLPLGDLLAIEPPPSRESAPTGRENALGPDDHRFHDWYRFVLSFPPHLVREYICNFGLSEDSTLLDPFCGTGTTVLEAKLNHIRGIGLEANPFPCFATSVKLDWSIDPDLLLEGSQRVAQAALGLLHIQGIDDNDPFGSSPNIALRDLDPEAS